MDYAAQQRFLESYSTQWLSFAAAQILLSSLALRDVRPATVTFVALMTVIALAQGYLPKYLHIHEEPKKRYRWIVRARWILISIALLVSAVVNFHATAILLLSAGAAVWALLVNGMVRVLFNRNFLDEKWMPIIYLLGDLWLVALFAYLGVDWFVLAALMALAFNLAVLLNRSFGFWFPLLLMALAASLLRVALLPQATALGSGFLVLAVALSIFAVSWLTDFSIRHAGHSRETTLMSLQEFTGFRRDEVKRRLHSSSQELADAWKAAKLDENDRDALARWYANHSLPYLFDLARFHLNYKHIAFTLDVLTLARGTCLDYGAGKGELAIELAARNRDVTYFDVPGKSREFAEWNARRRGIALRFSAAKEEIREVVSSAGLFDTVISLDVLEHLPDLQGELEFLTSVLAPGGKLILTLPVGATESHPMHLSHTLDAGEFLRGRGLHDAKSWRMKIFGSEILRKRECSVFAKAK